MSDSSFRISRRRTLQAMAGAMAAVALPLDAAPSATETLVLIALLAERFTTRDMTRTRRGQRGTKPTQDAGSTNGSLVSLGSAYRETRQDFQQLTEGAAMWFFRGPSHLISLLGYFTVPTVQIQVVITSNR